MQARHNIQLFFSILLWNLLPSIYFLVLSHFIKVSNADINVMGQMEWFDLIDEILVTTLTVPLYYILKDGKSDASQNLRITGTAFLLYAGFAVVIAFHIGSIAEFMQAADSVRYLFLQMVAMTAQFLLTLMVLLFTLHGKNTLFYALTVLKLLALALFDSFLMPAYQEYGAAYSNIAVNIVLAIVSVVLAFRFRLLCFRRGASCRPLCKEWARIGIPAGIQIFFDNWIYAVLVVKMVNEVSSAGAYWMANNFIWGWLIVPVAALAEIIKCNKFEKLTVKNSVLPSAIIAVTWLATMPFWYSFIKNGMSMDSSIILPIVISLLPFYFAYIACSALDAWFVSCGRTWCTMTISIVVNIGYYGLVYLFAFPSTEHGMSFIISMFGWGIVVHLAAGLILYVVVQKGKAKASA